MMKLAFMIIAHTDADQLENLVNRLCPNIFFESKVFIHLDAKSNMSLFERVSEKDYVQFTSRRVNVIRCGISQVEATLELMRTVISSGEVFDRYVLITGQDYPVVSNRELAEKLSRDVEYMRCYKVTDTPMNNKVRRYYFYTNRLTGTPLKKFIRRVVQLVCRVHLKKDTVIIDKMECDIYYSSAYFAVSHGLFCELYNKGTLTKYYQYFKTAITSDELYFATIAANSSFRNKLETVDNGSHTLLDNSALTYFEYQDRPIVLTEQNYNEIKSSQRLFARKFSSTGSKALMHLLEQKA